MNNNAILYILITNVSKSNIKHLAWCDRKKSPTQFGDTEQKED